MRIAITTTASIAGGAITHLRSILPWICQHRESDEILVLASRRKMEELRVPSTARWIEIPEGPGVRRLFLENYTIPSLLARHEASVAFHPANVPLLRCPIPQVTVVQNLAPFFPQLVSQERLTQKIRLRLLAPLTRLSLRRARRVIFLTRWSREKVLGISASDADHFPVVYWGSDHVDSVEEPSILDRLGLQSDHFLLCVSHLYAYKRIELLIEAHDTLPEPFRSFPLLIVGAPYDPDYADVLADRVARSGAPVRLLGALPPPAIFALMRRCSLFLFSSEAESLAVTLLEALRCGAPIVTNETCCLPEVCGEAATYVPRATAYCYAEAIEKLLTDRGRRAQLREHALSRSQNFLWEAAAKATLDVLRSAASHA